MKPCVRCKKPATKHCPMLLQAGPRVGRQCAIPLCPEHDLCTWHELIKQTGANIHPPEEH